MKNKVTLDDLKKIRPDSEVYLLNVALETINAAYEAVNEFFDNISKEEFLKVVASDYGAMHFIGKAYLAAREEEKSDLGVHAFYLFDSLQDKQTELA